MSMVTECTAMVTKLGRATADELMVHFPFHFRKQVTDALWKAKRMGLVQCLERGHPIRRTDLGNLGSHGKTAAVYGPGPPPPKPPDHVPVRHILDSWLTAANVQGGK